MINNTPITSFRDFKNYFSTKDIPIRKKDFSYFLDKEMLNGSTAKKLAKYNKENQQSSKKTVNVVKKDVRNQPSKPKKHGNFRRVNGLIAMLEQTEDQDYGQVKLYNEDQLLDAYDRGKPLNELHIRLLKANEQLRYTKKGVKRTDAEIVRRAVEIKRGKMAQHEKKLYDFGTEKKLREVKIKLGRSAKSDKFLPYEGTLPPLVRVKRSRPLENRPRNVYYFTRINESDYLDALETSKMVPEDTSFPPPYLERGYLVSSSPQMEKEPFKKERVHKRTAGAGKSKALTLGNGKNSSRYTKEERKAYHAAFAKKKAMKKAAKKRRQEEKKKPSDPTDVVVESKTTFCDLKETSFEETQTEEVASGPGLLGTLATVTVTNQLYSLISSISPAIKNSPVVVSMILFIGQLFTAKSYADIAMASLQYRLVIEANVELKQFELRVKQFIDENKHELEQAFRAKQNRMERDRKREHRRQYPPECKVEEVSDDEIELKYDNEGNCADDNDVVVESLTTILDDIALSAETIMSSSLVEAIRNIAVTLASFKLFDRDVSKNIYKWFGKLDHKMTYPEAFSAIVSNLSTVLKMADLYREGMPLSAILLSENPLKAAMVKAERYLQYADRLYFGLPVEGCMEARKFYVETEEVYSVLQAFEKKVNPLTAEGSRLMKLSKTLGSSRLAVMSELLSGRRPTPICLVYHGPPGTGKTMGLTTGCKLYCRVVGVEYSDTLVYTRVASSPFWDGYGLDKLIVHYSELGNKTKKMAEMGKDEILSELTSVLDGMSFTCDMSAVEDKGKTKFLSGCVVVDTNNKEMNLNYTVCNKAATMRRMIYIKQTVKPQYRLAGSQSIDPSLIPEGKEMDAWTWTITTRKAVDAQNYQEVVHCLDVDLDEYGRVLSDLMKKHIKKEERAVRVSEQDMFENITSLEADLCNNVVQSGKTRSFRGSVFEKGSRFCSNLGSSSLMAFYNLLQLFWLSACAGFYSTTNVKLRARITLFLILLMVSFYFSVASYFIVIASILIINKDSFNISAGDRTAKVMEVKKRIQSIHSYLTFSPFSIDAQLYLKCAGLIATLAGATYLYKDVTKKKKSKAFKLVEREPSKVCHETESQVADDVSPIVKRALDRMEEEFHCTKGYERFQTKNGQWNTRVIKPSPYTGSLESFYDRVARNLRTVKIAYGEYECHTKLLGIAGDLGIIHGHPFYDVFDEFVHLDVSDSPGSKNYTYSTIIKPSEEVVVKGDLLLIHVNCIRFANILPLFPDDMDLYNNVQAIFAHQETIAHRKGDPLLVRGIGSKNNVLEYPDVLSYLCEHAQGMCGTPVVGNFGKSNWILGVHSAGNINTREGHAIVVTKGELSRAIQSYAETKGSIISSECESRIEFGQGAIHPHSPVLFEELQSLVYYGPQPGFFPNEKSKLVRTPYAKHLKKIMADFFSYERSVVYAPPLMRPVGRGDKFRSPYNTAIRKMRVKKKCLPKHLIDKAIDIIFSHLCSALDDQREKGFLPQLSPLELETAINGEKKDAFLRRLDMTRSAGHGLKGKKSNYVQRKFDDWVIDTPVEQLVIKVLDIIEVFKRGESCHSVYDSFLKDEPRDVEKLKDASTRPVCGSEFAFLLVSKMFLAPLYTLMSQFPKIFRTSIGIDMHRKGKEIYELLENFLERTGSPKMALEGDYSKFDMSMMFQIGKAVMDICICLLMRYGYGSEHYLILVGIFTEGLFPMVSICGEMFCIPGYQPSGKYGTAEDNSMRNLVIQVLVWLLIPETRDEDFFSCTESTSLGDDLLIVVDHRFSEYYNAVSYAKVCNEYLGLGFTSTSKGDVMVPLIPLEDISFLKRNFEYHPILGTMVAKLSLDSIYKALEWMIPSSIGPMDQLEGLSQSMLREMFFHVHDERKFEEIRSTMLSILLKEFPGATFDFPTYITIRDSLCPIANSVDGGRQDVEVCSPQFDDIVCESKLIRRRKGKSSLLGRTIDHATLENSRSNRNILQVQDLLAELRAEHESLSHVLDNMENPMPGYNWRHVKTSNRYMDRSFRREANKYYELANRVHDLSLTIDRYARWLDREIMNVQVYTESMPGEMMAKDLSISNDEKRENVDDFVGFDPAEGYVGTSDTINIGQVNNLDMARFFERPIAIYEQALPVDPALFNYSFNPWDLYTLVPAVRAKLRNYAYLKATMCVQFSVSASPFEYGILMVSPQPAANNNEILTLLMPDMSTSFYRNHALTYLSQARGCSYINVKDNQPLVMRIPYVATQPAIRLFNNATTAIGAGTSYSDVLQMDHIYVYSIDTIRSASDASTLPSLQIYAWLEDVELGAPTGTVVEVTTESDEREVGPIENLATRFADVMGSLKSVPSIAHLAAASEIGANQVKTLASWFGFSKPSLNTLPTRMKPQPFQNGAETIGSDTTKRIVLDPKQELTIDPSVTGDELDEMCISYLTQKESYLGSFLWQTTDVAFSTNLWTMPISPQVMPTDVWSTGDIWTPTSLAFAAQPFCFWNGTICLRIEVICSAFHRGKFWVIYEPNLNQSALINTTFDLNKQYVFVVDIQESQDFCVSIEWAAPKAWLRTYPISRAPNPLGDPTSATTLDRSYANGYITIVPFNTLQCPLDVPVLVNLYISSPDMMFNQVKGTNLPVLRPPQLEEKEGEVVVESFTNKLPKTHHTLNPSTARQDNNCTLHFGETPISFRTLLKRYVGCFEPLAADVSISTKYLRYECQIWPSPNPTISGVTASTVQPNLFGYLRYAYVGLRGSMKHRIGLTGDYDVGSLSRVKIHLMDQTTTQPTRTFLSTASGLNDIDAKLIGSLDFIPLTNGGVEFETPYYSNNLFGFSFRVDPWPGNSTMMDNLLTRGFTALFPVKEDLQGVIHVTHDCAIGEDFSFLRFNGAPPYWVPTT